MVKVKDAFHWCVGSVKTHCANTFFYLMDYSNNLKNIYKEWKKSKVIPFIHTDLISVASSLKGYVFL